MPELDGAGLLAEMRQDEALVHLPVLLVTAGDGKDVAARFRAAYLRKPLKIDVLLRAVDRLLGPR